MHSLSNVSIYFTWRNIKKSYKNNKFKIPALMWNRNFELPDGSSFISVIQDYFEYISKQHGGKTDNLPIKIYVNKIENSITFRIKAGYYL